MGLHIYRANVDELVEGCRRRQKNAQRDLYDFYSATMFALCNRYVRDDAEAEDILVMGFTKAFERIDQFKGDGSFEGWLKRIMINESLTVLRKKSRVLHTEIEMADRQVHPEHAYDPLEVEDLLSLIRELPDGYRTVFNLYAIDGYSHQEIAERLGISENTSKSQLSRARTYLQKRLMHGHQQNVKRTSHDESAT